MASLQNVTKCISDDLPAVFPVSSAQTRNSDGNNGRKWKLVMGTAVHYLSVAVFTFHSCHSHTVLENFTQSHFNIVSKVNTSGFCVACNRSIQPLWCSVINPNVTWTNLFHKGTTRHKVVPLQKNCYTSDQNLFSYKCYGATDSQGCYTIYFANRHCPQEMETFHSKYRGII